MAQHLVDIKQNSKQIIDENEKKRGKKRKCKSDKENEPSVNNRYKKTDVASFVVPVRRSARQRPHVNYGHEEEQDPTWSPTSERFSSRKRKKSEKDIDRKARSPEPGSFKIPRKSKVQHDNTLMGPVYTGALQSCIGGTGKQGESEKLHDVGPRDSDAGLGDR